MNKNILLAGVLSVVVIFGSVFIYNNFFLKKQPAAATETENVPVAPVEPEPPEIITPADAAEPLILEAVIEENLSPQELVLENEVFRLTFTNQGGRIVSAVLRDFPGAQGGSVDLVYTRDEGLGILPFEVRSGGFTGPCLDQLFHYKYTSSGNGIVFHSDFLTDSGEILTLKKTFTLLPDEYMLKVSISFDSRSSESLPADSNGYIYSLEYGPGLGPEWEILDGRTDYRYYNISRSGEKRNMRPSPEGYFVMNDPADWLGIEGKYFAVISVPPERGYTLAWDARSESETGSRLSFFYCMTPGKDSSIEDVFYYYLGPKDRKILRKYNQAASNGFGLSQLNLERIIPGASIMLGVADALNSILELLYSVIPNYGIVIIIFTILIELLIFPLTKRSYDTTSKLRRVGPEIRQIKEKYQYDREKSMEKLQELYEREQIKGRPNMIPLLIHLPVFLLLYSILSSYINFRMEMFIPGWIPDISRPDAIWDFYPRVIPVLSWTAIRGLPILMFATALIQSRYTQSPDQLGRSMIFMSFLLPILLLFVMYNMPSGVVLYWTVHNLLNIAYQFYRRRRDRQPA